MQPKREGEKMFQAEPSKSHIQSPQGRENREFGKVHPGCRVHSKARDGQKCHWAGIRAGSSRGWWVRREGLLCERVTPGGFSCRRSTRGAHGEWWGHSLEAADWPEGNFSGWLEMNSKGREWKASGVGSWRRNMVSEEKKKDEEQWLGRS